MANTAALRARSLALFIILLSITTSAAGRFGGGGRHSSGGSHSHGTHHSYGTGSHSYGTGSHSYPSSNGLSGTGSGSAHSYPSSGGAHTYPGSTGLSGNNNNIQKQTHTYQHNSPNYGPKTEVHHHYHYSPPQHVSYGAHTFPVYHGQPPVYVYQYRDSGSRFDNLLTGLALYNLGKMSASHHHSYDSDRRYVGTPGEVCKLGIRKSNGDYEETRVNCELMSSFIWESESETHQTAPKNTITTSVVNVTQTHTGEVNNSVTTMTVTNTTVVDALQAKGQSIQVTPDMTCYMIRITRMSNMKKEIKCGVLEAYARSSWRNSADRVKTSSALLLTLLVIYTFVIN